MSQPQFICRPGGARGKAGCVQLARVWPEWKPIYREHRMPGSIFTHLESTGRVDKQRIIFSVPNYQVVCTRTAAGIKDVLRRLRPQEASVLDDIDTRIAALESELKQLRVRRREVVKDAFQRGHVVTLAEMEQWIAETETEREARRAEAEAEA